MARKVIPGIANISDNFSDIRAAIPTIRTVMPRIYNVLETIQRSYTHKK